MRGGWEEIEENSKWENING
jgi:hypothetical protein